jgi:predicted transposase YdaD
MKTAKKNTMERGTDDAFLQLMTVSGSSILKLLGVPPKQAERYQFRSVNLKEKLFEPDLEGIPLLLSKDEPVFIEFQGYSDKFIRYRLAIEVFQGCVQQKYEGKAIAGIIYTDPEYQTAALPLKALTAKNDQRLESFKEIVLTDYTESKLLAIDPKLIVLAPFTISTHTQKVNLLKKAQAWKYQIARFFTSTQQREVLDIMGLFILNRFRNCTYEEVKAMLNFDLMDTVAGQQVYDMGVQKGIEEGHQDGLEEGRIEGIEEGVQKGLKKGFQNGLVDTERAMIIKALGERFGVVSTEITEVIHAFYQQDELDELFGQALRCSDMAHFKSVLFSTLEKG